jgi:protein-tyrosine phosphatase
MAVNGAVGFRKLDWSSRATTDEAKSASTPAADISTPRTVGWAPRSGTRAAPSTSGVVLEQVKGQHPRMVQVDDYLWRGKQPEPGEVAGMGKMGIVASVNLREGEGVIAAEKKEATSAGMRFLNIGLKDRGLPRSPLEAKAFIDFVASPQNQPVYVHCQKGVGRTGMMVAAYRMAIPDRNKLDATGKPRVWTADEAIAEAKVNGLGTSSQLEWIRKFEQTLKSGALPGYPRAEPLPPRNGRPVG